MLQGFKKITLNRYDYWKVQRPIMPPDGPWLIYNAEREGVEIDADLVGEKLQEIMGDEYKVYVRGYFDSLSTFHVQYKISDTHSRANF